MLTIGQVAAATQASAKSIRQLETMGLLPPVQRRGTYRHFDETHVQAILLIRQAQALGFTLAELRALGKDDCTPDWPRFVDAIAAKRRFVQAEVARLQQRDQALAHLAETLPALLNVDIDCQAVGEQVLKSSMQKDAPRPRPSPGRRRGATLTP